MEFLAVESALPYQFKERLRKSSSNKSFSNPSSANSTPKTTPRIRRRYTVSTARTPVMGTKRKVRNF